MSISGEYLEECEDEDDEIIGHLDWGNLDKWDECLPTTNGNWFDDGEFENEEY